MKARTIRLIPDLPKTVSSLGTGASSPAPVGKYRPESFKLQVWDYSPCAHGVRSQTPQGGTEGSALRLTDVTLRMTLLVSYMASDVTCEGEGPVKKIFFPTNTQVRVL